MRVTFVGLIRAAGRHLNVLIACSSTHHKAEFLARYPEGGVYHIIKNLFFFTPHYNFWLIKYLRMRYARHFAFMEDRIGVCRVLVK